MTRRIVSSRRVKIRLKASRSLKSKKAGRFDCNRQLFLECLDVQPVARGIKSSHVHPQLPECGTQINHGQYWQEDDDDNNTLYCSVLSMSLRKAAVVFSLQSH